MGQGRLPRLLKQIEKARLLSNVPLWIAGAIVRQHGLIVCFSPGAQPRAGHRGQVFDDCRAIHFQKEILVGLFFEPQFLGFCFRARGQR